MTSLPPSAGPGVITIDLRQIAANWCVLADLVRPAECGAVVKANAYGLGADRIIPALVHAGCRSFFVATPGEATQARMLAPTATLYALDGLLAGCADELLAASAIPVLASMAEVREWSALATQIGARLATALHVDTGLNRLGLSAGDVEALMREPGPLAPLDVRLIMSHLASADDPADPKNEAQRAVFDTLRARLPEAPASLAASDGLMLGAPYHYELVRPGYGLYGGQAFRGGPTPVASVLRVAARVLQVRDVSAGETVGYSGSWRAGRAARVAVVSIGYADGYPRAASATNDMAGGRVLVRGVFCPIAGRVSMDLITVDVTDVPVLRGDLVDVIGPGLSIETVGTHAGTIGYEVLTRLGQRFERVYVGEEADIPSSRTSRGEG